MSYPRTRDQEIVLDNVERNYRRRYKVTLDFSVANVERALHVEESAALKGIETAYGAVMNTYGFRYRRMENFLRETAIIRPYGHMHKKVLLSFYGKTISEVRRSRVDKITLELQLYTWIPVGIIYNEAPRDMLLEYGYELLGDVASMAGWPVMSLDEFRAGVEVLEEHDWLRVSGDYTFCEGTLTVTRTKVIRGRPDVENEYTYRVEVKLAKYYPYIIRNPRLVRLWEVLAVVE